MFEAEKPAELPRVGTSQLSYSNALEENAPGVLPHGAELMVLAQRLEDGVHVIPHPPESRFGYMTHLNCNNRINYSEHHVLGIGYGTHHRLHASECIRRHRRG